MTTITQDRTAYGCMPWCTFDHAGPVYVDPGSHERDLATIWGGDAVRLHIWPSSHPTRKVTLYVGDDGVDYPASRETVERLRALAAMLRDAADALSRMLQSRELG